MVANIVAYRYEKLHDAQYTYRIEYTIMYTSPLKIGDL